MFSNSPLYERISQYAKLAADYQVKDDLERAAYILKELFEEAQQKPAFTESTLPKIYLNGVTNELTIT